MSRPRRRRHPLSVALGGLLTLVVLLGAVVLALRAAYAGQALPGTRVAGVALGGASAPEARRRLATVARTDVPVMLTAAGRRLPVRPADAGYRVDLDATVRAALAAGRDGVLGGAVATIGGVVRPRDVALVTHVDGRRLERAVAAVAAAVDRRPFPGQLRITGAPVADVQAVAPREGRTVDRGRLRAAPLAALRSRHRARLDVPLTVTPVATPAAVEEVGRQASRFLTGPLRLTGAGAPLTVTPGELAGVLALEELDGGRRVRLGAYDQKLRALVDRVAKQRDRPAADARITASGKGGGLSAKGDTSWRPHRAAVSVSGGRTGRLVRRPETVAAVEAAIRAGRHTLALPVRRVLPAVPRGQAREVDQLIGTFTTMYVPGQPRVTNIRRIARAVDGTVIAAGKQFSLNGVAGERTQAKGYVEAPFIAEGNKLEPSVGGGVSQASTTIYNAAYFAGLRIDSHTPHSVFISRYPAGRESTLNFGSIDLLWTNDTPAPILVRATTTATSITVSLFGHNGGRRVRAESAARQQVPGGDFSVVVTRVVRYPGGRVKREPFSTRYGIEQPSGR